jgi:hypothetical protein
MYKEGVFYKTVGEGKIVHMTVSKCLSAKVPESLRSEKSCLQRFLGASVTKRRSRRYADYCWPVMRGLSRRDSWVAVTMAVAGVTPATIYLPFPTLFQWRPGRRLISNHDSAFGAYFLDPDV